MASVSVTRRGRILLLAALASTICLLVFAFSSARDNALLFGESDESQVKLDLEKGARPPGGKDLTSKPGESFEPEKEFKEILSMSPVIIFSKTTCPHSNLVKKLLEEYQITPAPTFVELDKHPHGAELQAYIGELTDRKTVPNVFVNGVTRGGGDEMKELHQGGELGVMFQKWGGNDLRVKRLSAPSAS